ncbi:hypothetical protein EO087_03820 [Dyella sp. M7H15-1]|nr:hypothetical protein EO087_03820 [Dyella sp. M7H15-1]
MLSERTILDDVSFVEVEVEVEVWRVPSSILGSTHEYKYSLTYVECRVCVLRFDNERGKGDHYHDEGQETPYNFTTLEALFDDFWALVDTKRAPP